MQHSVLQEEACYRKGEKNMFCNSCGKPNPDGSAFCSSCGKPLAGATQQTPSAPQQKTQPASANYVSTKPSTSAQESISLFRRGWRQMAMEPLALVTVIVHSLSVLVNFIAVNDVISQMESAMYMFGISLDLVKILLIAPGALIAIGMWMLYADALDRSDRPIKTAGLTIILVVEWIMVGLCVIGGFAIVSSGCSAIDDLPYYYDTSAITRLLACVALGLVVGIVLASFIIKLITRIREAADTCSPDTDYVTGIAVLEFISAGIIVIAMIASSDFSLGTILSAAMPVLFGIMLLRYKEYMEELQWKMRRINEKPAVQEDNIVLTGWRCACGRSHMNYESSCACGRTKTDNR